MDAVEHAVVNTAEMAADITRFAEKELGLPRVEFRTDETQTPQLSLEGEETERRAVDAAQLRTCFRPCQPLESADTRTDVRFLTDDIE